jgi:hypothetical protein
LGLPALTAEYTISRVAMRNSQPASVFDLRSVDLTSGKMLTRE